MSRSDAHARGGLAHPPTVLLLALATQVAISFALASDFSVPPPIQVAGGALIVAGFVLNVLAARSFDRHGTPIRPGSDAVVLVTQGVFRWTRNPMYLGMAAIVGGSALALGNTWALLVLPGFVLWSGRLIRWEEELLEHTFGDRYRAYRRRVRRWL